MVTANPVVIVQAVQIMQTVSNAQETVHRVENAVVKRKNVPENLGDVFVDKKLM